MRRPIRRREVPVVDFGPGMDPLLARIYAARGVRGRDEVQDYALSHLARVSTLEAVEAAAALIAEHMARGGEILVLGDYDADGATATALVVRGLRALGHSSVSYLVPDRAKFGYGLTLGIAEVAILKQPSLIITVDNGVSSLEGIARVRAAGIDVLVTDHHLPGQALPAANVIVNPNLANSGFVSRALAGVGVAFYVLNALARHLGQPAALMAQFLDLVALGTVADVVPLDRNNRILVEQGLRRIREGRCVPGINALAVAAGRSLATATPTDLGFTIGPRLNAAGRLEDMRIGIECLLADDAEQARQLAEQLDVINRKRRSLEADTQDDAMAIVARLRLTHREGEQPAALTLFDASWHPGVVGLVAGRVKDVVHRPVVVFAPAEDGLLRGSVRSVPGIHVRDALEAVSTAHPGLIDRFGGHAMAAGLSLQPQFVKDFATAFEREVAKRAEPGFLEGAILTDGELTPAEWTVAVADRLRAAGPFGSGFPEPQFDGEFRVRDVKILKDRHLKMTLVGGPQTPPMEGMAFNWMAKPDAWEPARDSTIRAVYRLDVNEWQGLRRPQLVLEYLEPIETTRML
jgi:single-stranded-DNA-specific exonuclease